MGSLQAQEARLNRQDEKNEEKAFHIKREASNQKNVASRGRGRGGFSGRGRGGFFGRGRERRDNQQSQVQQHRGNKSGIQCYNCKKFGHVKADCWQKEQ